MTWNRAPKQSKMLVSWNFSIILVYVVIFSVKISFKPSDLFLNAYISFLIKKAEHVISLVFSWCVLWTVQEKMLDGFGKCFFFDAGSVLIL